MAEIIAFKLPEAPPLQTCDLRLHPQTCAIEMTLTDAEGRIFKLTYDLAAKSPEVFDLDLLRDAWARWREESELAL